MTIEEIIASECNPKFVQGMDDRMVVSFYKYGPIKTNYGTEKMINAIATMKLCIEAYEKDGNTEHLLDAGNYARIEYTYPQHPKAHFRATDSKESVGIVGVSINEIKNWEGKD